ncbi:hypothetical protein CCB80_15515 [Armatimonadetes bacterium Uphvl-Ar1]|nr:hypothetical protein CCB80_15515 [Armatimonadetes bacterium Uphvl-Ar1]
MPVDLEQYWSPAPHKTLQLAISRRLIHFVSRILFAFLVVALAQGIAGVTAPDSTSMWLLYGLGLFFTQWMSGWFLDLATGDKLGTPPGERTSKIIYFLAIALRAAPHSIFLAWVFALLSDEISFPDPAIIAFYQIALPLLSLRKLSSPPVLLMPGHIQLRLPRESDLYQGIVERFRPGGWLENVKYVRLQTPLTPREALFLINLVHQDHKSRS